MAEKENKIVVGPKELHTTYVAPDGTQITFRSDPSRPTSRGCATSSMPSRSRPIYYRFMSAIKRIPRKQMRDFVFIDHRTEVAIVGTLPEAYGEEIIAVGRYWLDPKTNRAEIAFTVQDDWQRKGIGTFLFRYLMRIARRNGIRGFTAEVLADNKPMQKVFNKSNSAPNAPPAAGCSATKWTSSSPHVLHPSCSGAPPRGFRLRSSPDRGLPLTTLRSGPHDGRAVNPGANRARQPGNLRVKEAPGNCRANCRAGPDAGYRPSARVRATRRKW